MIKKKSFTISKLDIFRYLCITFVTISLASCNVTKQLGENESVLRKNKIIVLDQEQDLINDFFYKDELNKIPRQKPNKKFLGMPWSEGIWAYYNKKKVTKFTQYMKTKIGTPPIIFDTAKLEQSKFAFKNYYFNIGYFDNQVDVDFKIKNKKTEAYYYIHPNNPYIVRNVYRDTSTPLEKLVNTDVENSSLPSGEVFKIDSLIGEIDRITGLAVNNGYYTFNKEFIRYKLDTFKNPNVVDVYIIIDSPTDSTYFEIYTLDTFRIQINREDRVSDTTNLDKTIIGNYIFYQNLPKQYNEKFLTRFIYQKENSIYSKYNVTRTIQRLSELSNFKLINSLASIVDSNARKVDMYYSLTPYKKYGFSFGVSTYNSNLGYIGTSLSTGFKDKNLTKFADRLSISLSGSVEFNAYLRNTKNYSGLISRTDVSFIADYKLDKFILPFLFSKKLQYLYNFSEFNAHYTFSRRLGYYDIHDAGTYMGFRWSAKQQNSFTYHPVLFNFIYIPDSSITDQFQNLLNQNPFLKSSFTSAFILGQDFSYNHIAHFGKNNNVFRYKFDFETAGNSAYIVDKIFNISDTNTLSIVGVDVSQYLKLQMEFGLGNPINKNTSFHSRFKSGIVMPYLNSKDAPYVKQFYMGGQYSIRAFQARTIGPGSYNPGEFDTDSSVQPRDQLGNLMAELNFEYRFKIVSFIRGALFADMGNIWYTNQKWHQSPDAIFRFNSFYKQIYIGTGFGVRLDFNYFVLRVDFGIPVRVPYEEREWVILDAKPFNGEWIRNNLVLNIAVGYPF